jgi:hypothetical protein
MTSWETIRRQVAISGRVSSARTGKPCPDARVEITNAPAAFLAWLQLKAIPYGKRWSALSQRPDRLRTNTDGCFHFLDLPDGDYTLTVAWPQQGSRYGTAQTTVTVARNADGIIVATTDLALPPTTVRGRITNNNNTPISLAEIRMQGSGERSYSDRAGNYQLLPLEASDRIRRTVVVSASGYQTSRQTVDLNQPGVARTLNFILTP